MAGQCVYGAARDITSMDAGARRSASFCAAAPSLHRAACFNGIGTILGGFTREANGRRAACRSAVPKGVLGRMFRRRGRLTGAVRVVLPCLLAGLLTACGASGGEDTAAGKQVFIDAGCGDCHSLAATGSTGTIGPDLDQVRPDAASVVQQVTHGGGAMPSFGRQALGERDPGRRRVRLRIDTPGKGPRLRGGTVPSGRHGAGGLRRRVPLLRAGVRQCRVSRGTEACALPPRQAERKSGPDRERLSPDNSRHRRGSPRALRW